ncbi:TrkA family potassium uptake protein, partial [Halobacteriales archaeon QS_9_70_65]
TEGPVTPRGETTIHAGDVLTVYSATGVTEPVLDVFTE